MKRFAFVVSVAALVSTLAGCFSPPPPPFADPNKDVPFEKRLEEAEKDLIELARLDAQEECFAPDAGVDAGALGEELSTLVRPNEFRQECIDLVDAIIEEAPEGHPFRSVDELQGFPTRANDMAPAPSPVRFDRERRVELEKRCGPLMSTVRRAVDSGLACNPCGIAKEPCDDFIELMTIRFPFAYMAGNGLMTEGDDTASIEERLDMCSDVLEFTGRLAKNAELIRALVAAEIAEEMAAASEALLNSGEEISQDTLQEFSNRLGEIGGDWPSLSSTIRAAPSWDVFRALEWKKDADCWVVHDKEYLGASSTKEGQCAHRTESALFIALYMAEKRLADAACAKAATDVDCLKKAKRVSEIHSAYQEEYSSKTNMLMRYLREAHGKESINSDLDPLETVTETAAHLISARLDRLPRARFILAAVRLLARYRLEYERTGFCPGEEFFARDDLREFTEDPTCGEPMEVERLAPGRFVLRSGASAGTDEPPEEGAAVFIHCPFFGLGEASALVFRD